MDRTGQAADGQLTAVEFVSKHLITLCNQRQWHCAEKNVFFIGQNKEKCPYLHPHCWGDCGKNMDTETRQKIEMNRKRMQDYHRYFERLDEWLGERPIAELTLQEIKVALEGYEKKYNAQPLTMKGIESCLRIVWRHLERLGAGYDIMRHLPFRDGTGMPTNRGNGRNDRAMMGRLFGGEIQNREEMRQLVTILRVNRPARRKWRSLTIRELERLTKTLQEEILVDGRACGMAVGLYTGGRPAELRGLTWGDLRRFLDHPERLLLVLNRSATQQGGVKERMKTRNAHRLIPIHMELHMLMEKRYQFILAQLEKPIKSLSDNLDEDVAKMPICSLENMFETACQYSQMAGYAKGIFERVMKISEEDRISYMLEMLEDDLESGEESELNAVQGWTLYSLRKAFWTWLSAATGSGLGPRRYVMGHEDRVNGRNQHHKHNDENELWDLLNKMDRCVINASLHLPMITRELKYDEPQYFHDRGIIRLRIPKEMLENGVVRLNLITTQPDDLIGLRCCTPLEEGVCLNVCGRMLAEPYVEGNVPSMPNSEFDLWAAHEKYLEESLAEERADTVTGSEEKFKYDAITEEKMEDF